MDNDKKIALFSGKFDPPHCGHIATLQRLAERYNIIVVILDHKDREYPAEYSKDVLEEILANSHGNYQIEINNTHFAEITKEELNKWKFSIYVAGNIQVLKHIASFGYPIMYADRAYAYEAGDERLAQKIKKVLTF